ncbi:hypothetical protein GCM10010466_48080 [Planomonospora alba]|uniref:Uncharacterized protein n=1 Tax=Planomonospora alba TaxID=161354 RepID=A0ABP6NKP3_9ACTN
MDLGGGTGGPTVVVRDVGVDDQDVRAGPLEPADPDVHLADGGQTLGGLVVEEVREPADRPFAERRPGGQEAEGSAGESDAFEEVRLAVRTALGEQAEVVGRPPAGRG